MRQARTLLRSTPLSVIATTPTLPLSASNIRPSPPTLVLGYHRALSTSQFQPFVMSSTSASIATATAAALATSAADLDSHMYAPPARRGMTVLDKSQFDVAVPCTAVSVPATHIGTLKKEPLMRREVLQLPKTNSVIEDPNDKTRRLILLKAASPDKISEAARAYLDNIGVTYEKHEVVLGWDNWNANQLLNAVLPLTEDEVPSSYTQTGHIAHLNLRSEWLPYKTIIGEVLLEKIPSVKTVVNKLDSIHDEFRFFDMEVLAGEPEFVTSTHESGCSFVFDFSKVYWNSRLHTEHARLLSQFPAGCVVADAMAGVGPFAVPAAKNGAYVLANDLNPESAKWMTENQKKNKVAKRLRITNMDAREFIRNAPLQAWRKPFTPSVPKSNREQREEAALRRRNAGDGLEVTGKTPTPPAVGKPQTIDHFVMNLPDSALEFLDAYQGAFAPLLLEDDFDPTNVRLPLIHVHCFTRCLEPEDAKADINARASERLGYKLTDAEDGYNLHHVRRVAPTKDMYCLTFRLPGAVAY